MALSTANKSNLKPVRSFRLFSGSRYWPFLTLTLLILSLSGCKNQNRSAGLSPAATHGITKEFAASARQAAPAGTVIRMKLQAKQGDAATLDRLEITVFEEESPTARKTNATKILRALADVAERHKLLAEKKSDGTESTSIGYRLGSRTTHVIEIRFAGKQQQNSELSANAPKLAIILDDLGSDRAAAEAIFAMPYPLTISVLPNHEHSTEIAEEALQRGYQVMLHLPMQSVASDTPEKEELRPGMPREAVQAMLEKMIESVPNAVGLNNHQGSQATSDPVLMAELMPALHNWNLFYVDSRTTAATVAFDTARRDGVPAAFRNVPFLDDVQDVAAICKQLELALRGAKGKKAAIAIGHPHPATLQALREFLPHARSSGVRLVFASELVR